MNFRLGISCCAAGLALTVILTACQPLATPAPLTSPTPVVQPIALLGLVENIVNARASAGTAFEPAVAGAILGMGAELQTAQDSQARLDLPDGSFLRLAPNTGFTLVSLPTPRTDAVTTVKLGAGKVWAGLAGGALLVSTPAGVATVRAGRSAVEFIPGDPGSTADDIFIVTCLASQCSLWTEAVREELTALEQMVVTGGQAPRQALTENDLADYAAANPEADALVPPTPAEVAQVVTSNLVAPTAVPVVTEPPVATQPPATVPAPTAIPPTNPPPASLVPAGGLLGQHVVRPGDTFFCLGRGYGVVPEAIAAANDLPVTAALSPGQSLAIPAVRWESIPPGPACGPQFASPYLPGAAVPPTTAAVVEAATPTGQLVSEPAVVTATPLPEKRIWAAPVNLSQSGDALQPAIAADNLGNFYALWWDRFEAARLAIYQPGLGWSAPAAVPGVVGATRSGAASAPKPPRAWRLLVDPDGVAHALWINTEGSLVYAHRDAGFGAAAWSAPNTLALAVTAWDAIMPTDGALHLALIRAEQAGSEPPGVYYLRRPRLAAAWDPAQLLAGSLYFRSLSADAAHVTVTGADTGQVVVTWDDPQVFDSRLARSLTGGQDFEAPVPLAAADSAAADRPRRLRLVGGGARGGLLRLWQRGSTCELYQEQLNPADGAWSPPVRVLEDMLGCFASTRATQLPDGRLVLWATLSDGGSAPVLLVWDGHRWSSPSRPRVTFVNSATGRPAALDCLDGAFFGEQLMVVGCDGRGDVWGALSNLPLAELLPALASAWQPLVALSPPGADAGLPWVTRDAAGQLHALWTQISSALPDQQPLYYARHTGEAWTPAVRILQLPEGGPANSPVIMADPRDWLHAVWSGGAAGQIYYSRAFRRDGTVVAGWSPPRALPARQPAGGWPALVLEASGRLVVLYTIPLNEERGVYLTASTDAGESWSEPSPVLAAVGAGWPAVQDTQLAIDTDGRLHLMVVKGPLPPATVPLGVYYLTSDDGGQTWTLPVQVGGAGAGFPRLLAGPHGELHRLWVQTGATEEPVWHQWSRDGGASWSPPRQVPGLRDIAPNLGLVSDAQGTLYLVGLESTRQDTAALFYLRWADGQWLERENLPLGQGADAASGAAAILLPSGHLGVLYRVTTSVSPGAQRHQVGYAERSLPAVEVPLVATAAAPEATTAGVTNPAPTLAVVPTRFPSVQPAPKPSTTPWVEVVGILAGMVVVAAVAISRLRAEFHPRL